MIRVCALYPFEQGASFDVAYYADHHMPLVQRLCGDAMKGFQVDRGISGAAPGSNPPYFAIGYLLFDTTDAFHAAMAANAAEIVRDVTNYTTVMPLVQISEVVA